MTGWRLTVESVRRAVAESQGAPVRQRMSRRDRAGRVLPRAEAPTSGRPALPAAVLLLLYSRAGALQVPFTVRAAHLPHHAGQISFPGGAVEPADPDPWSAALREAGEEIGLEVGAVEPWGELTPVYVRPSNYLVRPFVAHVDPPPVFRPARDEVADVFEVPLADLLRPSTFRYTLQTMDGVEYWIPEFVHGRHRIWGATASILDQLLARIERCCGEGAVS